MPNHHHLQIETPRLNLSEAIKWLNLSYVSWFNRKTRRNGPLLQRRFKAVVHDPDETGWTIHEYIHLNPVRVKRFGASRSDREGPSAEQMVEMVSELTEFRWSSYRSYAGYISEKPPVDWERNTVAIQKLWRKPWKEVSRLHGDPGRELAMLIAQSYGGMSLREIGEAVGGLQYPAVSDAVRRTSARLETDGALQRKFKRLRKSRNLDSAEKP